MATAEERREEACQDMRERPECIGCHLGIWHDHDDQEDEDR